MHSYQGPVSGNPWYEYYGKPKDHSWAESSDRQGSDYLIDLHRRLATYSNVTFDHVKIGHLGRRIAVFVVKGSQSAVLYDKTKGFPSAKLMASLVLLGS